MGSFDTLEIANALPSPLRLVLLSHRRGTEITVPVNEACYAALNPLLQEPGATLWLRSVSRTLRPFFVFWRRTENFALVVRVKHGASRREVRVLCSKESGQALLAVSREEWSDAA